jgi:hypothetical protein
MSGPVGVQKRNLQRSGFPPRAFFKEDAAFVSAVFTEIVFVNQAVGSEDNGRNFESGGIRLTNDGGGDLFYSFDGVTVHGHLLAAGDNFDTSNIRRSEFSIFLRSVGTSYRLDVW